MLKDKTKGEGMENLKKKIDEARKIVGKLGLEEPYKSEAFGAVLTRLLLEEGIEEEVIKKPKPEIELKAKIENLAKDAGLTEEQLKHVFNFEENDLDLIAPIKGSWQEKQLKTTVTILTGLRYCYEKDKILSTHLKRKLENLGIGSLSQLGPTLSEHPQLIIPRGKGRFTSYKITEPGKKEGLKIIKELVEGSG